MNHDGQKEIDVASKAMMRDLTKRKNYNHGCLFMFIPKYPENVVVRGHIDLTSLARAAIKAVDKLRGHE